MLTGDNVGVVSGRLVADPERKGNNVVLMRLAVDYAGKDTENPDNKSGFFNVVFFTNDNDPTTRFIDSQMSKGNLKKGSAVSVVYSLMHNRFVHENNRRDKVELIGHGINYYGSKGRSENSNNNNQSNQNQAQSGNSSNYSNAQSTQQSPAQNFIPPEF